MIRSMLLLFCFLLITSNSICQKQQKLKPLSVGDRVPAEIWKSIPKNKDSKLVILDFWQTTCKYCLACFPKMANLQNQFPKELQIVLVNSKETDTEIKNRFAKINSKRNKNELLGVPASLSSLTGKIIFKELFPYLVIPHHVWLDKNGKVLSITQEYNATTRHVMNFLNGGEINFNIKNDFDSLSTQLITTGIVRPVVKSMPVYYSALMGYYYTPYNSQLSFDTTNGTAKLTSLNMPIGQLYQNAFYTVSVQRTIIEYHDSKILWEPEDKNDMDSWNTKYCFSYEFQMPIAHYRDPDKFSKLSQQIMQKDLNLYLGNLFGIEGLIEKRKLYCFVLTKIGDITSLVAEGGESVYAAGPAKKGYTKNDGLSLANYPFSGFFQTLQGSFEDMKNGRAFVNETGIKDNVSIDINLSGDLSNIKNTRLQLNRYGLDIIEAEREIEVLVIRDKEK